MANGILYARSFQHPKLLISPDLSFFNIRIGTGVVGLGVGCKVWVLAIGVLEVNPELDSIRAQRGRAQRAFFSQVFW